MARQRNGAVLQSIRTMFNVGVAVGLTDGQLLERFATRRGEAAELAFAALAERHGPMVLRVCRGILRDDHDAQDAFQATFLILARRGGTLWVRDSLGPWLHRVACRVAARAKRISNRRRAAERRAAEMTERTVDEPGRDDLGSMLHEELDRLPARYRVPIVLCDLEGRTYEEVARHLGCPIGTIKSRLARGRERLRGRLIRCGLTTTCGFTVVATGAKSASAAVSPLLVDSTLRVVMRFVGGGGATYGAISPSVVTLTKGELKAMLWVKLKLVMAGVLSAMVAAAVAVLAHAQQGSTSSGEDALPVVTKATGGAAEIQGNWIVRGYPSGQALGLLNLGTQDQRPRASLLQDQQPRASLLAVGRPDFFLLGASAVEGLRVDERAVRFTLRLESKGRSPGKSFAVDVYLPGGERRPEMLLGSMEHVGIRFPAKLERTDLKDLDPKEADELGPGVAELQKSNRGKGVERKEILEGILEKHSGEPIAFSAAIASMFVMAEINAPKDQVHSAADRSIRLAAPYGPELRLYAVQTAASCFVETDELADLALDYARKAEALLQPSDPIALQTSVLKTLASSLRNNGRMDEARAVDDRIAKLGEIPNQASLKTNPSPKSLPAASAKGTEESDTIAWAKNFATARREAKAGGKLIMVDFTTENCRWCKRLDADVFPTPAVARAAGLFVPVKVRADPGQGTVLAEKYAAHIRGYPTILFIDPSSEGPAGFDVVGKIPGFMPPTSFADRMQTVAKLPRDLATLRARHKAQPGDTEAVCQLVAALALRGEAEEAADLARRVADSAQDSEPWAAINNIIGDEYLSQAKSERASDWFRRAARVAKRPIDLFHARLGLGMNTVLQGKVEEGRTELEAAARVPDLPDGEVKLAQELIQSLIHNRTKSSPGSDERSPENE